ncbi:hypothetical protein MITS9509_02841 [Synechococcus sp. MIT S9509]|uniref:hypothetical protein n=1 Tax=unclassified Synechococcus TaxID=2626047 RepID=UPI0007BC7D85|nr:MULTISPECIES: hypothetical protein [unclassified Synechococcus]KZR84903.1 hypothetical protein MITS9504_02521 [Synechococcus sp. MIT S9504]KZR90156.1 hypothetical protein MITS9509_02841 [Synechococcus sp. MIT S9509]
MPAEQPTPEVTRQALLKLLSEVTDTGSRADAQATEVGAQINLAIERVKADASEGAAPLDACGPHGRAMLIQAQKRLENFQALQVLEAVASESFGML